MTEPSPTRDYTLTFTLTIAGPGLTPAQEAACSAWWAANIDRIHRKVYEDAFGPLAYGPQNGQGSPWASEPVPGRLAAAKAGERTAGDGSCRESLGFPLLGRDPGV